MAACTYHVHDLDSPLQLSSFHRKTDFSINISEPRQTDCRSLVGTNSDVRAEWKTQTHTNPWEHQLSKTNKQTKRQCCLSSHFQHHSTDTVRQSDTKATKLPLIEKQLVSLKETLIAMRKLVHDYFLKERSRSYIQLNRGKKSVKCNASSFSFAREGSRTQLMVFLCRASIVLLRGRMSLQIGLGVVFLLS